MTKEFVPHSLAVKLKVLGFDWPCYAYIYTGDTGNNYDHYLEVKPSDAKDWNDKSDLCISRPLFQQAFRWFREKYDWTIKVNQVSKNNWSYTLSNFPNDKKYYGELCQTYEEAETACLEKLIEIIYQTK
jgi:hypothetical protein